MRTYKIFLQVFILALVLFSYGCAQQKPMTATKRQQPMVGRSDYDKLQVLYESKQYDEYMTESSKFLIKYPNSDYGDKLCYQRGILLLGLKKYQEASEELKKVIDAHSNSDLYYPSLYYYALSEYKNNNPESGLKALDKMDAGSGKDQDIYLKSRMLKANILSEQGDRKGSLEGLAELYSKSTDPESKSKVKVYSLSVIDKMNTSELRSVEGKYKDTGFADAILFKLGEKYFEEEGAGAARDRFNELLSSYPETEYRGQAESYLARLEGIDKADPFTVGVILPLSGRNAAFGMKTLSGIQLALGVFGPQKTRSIIKLSVMDSQSDPGVAKSAVDKLLSEDKVSAIIGPLSGDESELVAKQCSLAGVPNITLSQKENIDGLGRYVFRMSMTNRGQVKRLVDYSMGELGMKKFGILYPNDNYGQELSKSFWEEVLKKGGEITAVEYYEPGQSDFRNEVKKLLDLYYVAARLPELKELEEEMKKEEALAQSEGRKIPKNKKEVQLPPVIGFEALFIPDDARVAAQIAPYLPYYDARGIVLLGTNTWNSYKLVARGGEHVEGAIFIDGFYSNPSFEEGRSFYQDYKNAFNNSPGILEAQGYDAGKLLAKAIDNLTDGGKKKDPINRESLRKEISSMGTFTGATGKISFDDNGEVKKELFVLGVDKGKIILKK